MPALVDDGPGRVVELLLIFEEDRQEGYSWQETAAPELQDAAPVAAGALWGHHQEGESSINCSA